MTRASSARRGGSGRSSPPTVPLPLQGCCAAAESSTCAWLEHRGSWTRAAQAYFGGLCKLIGHSVAYGAGWTKRRALDPAGCAKLGCGCRIGEAKNPGPRHPIPKTRAAQRAGDLESAPAHARNLGITAWESFLSWARLSLSFDPLPSLFLCPALLAMALRAYGNHLYVARQLVYLYRYALVGAQRASWTFRPALAPAWELLSRWELLEPAVHRTPVPEALLKAMLVVTLLHGMRRWAGVTCLAYFGMGRIGEVLKCRLHHLVLASDLVNSSSAVFLRLEHSSGSAPQG